MAYFGFWIYNIIHGELGQPGEHLRHMQGVMGSNPILSTIVSIAGITAGFFLARALVLL